MKKSQVIYSDGFPKLEKASFLVIYDQKLSRFPSSKKWLGQFKNKVAVRAGEGLKDIDQFPTFVKRVLKLVESENLKDLTVVAVGGGSVGDFAGFLASVLKRGVGLVHIPTTWLAAIDSAHGGKTALNVGEHKNQIGSFYPASKVYISKKLLSTQNDSQLRSAYGELFKIALIKGGKFSKQVLKLHKLDHLSLWKLLPEAVRAKMKIVEMDPFEKKKLRYLLNLGHTFGHALELENKITHGEAVLLGTQFALRWSLQKKLLSKKQFEKIESKRLVHPKLSRKLKAVSLKKALGQDKKMTGNSKVQFVFLKKPGQCTLKKVGLNEVVVEAKRQGWVS